MKPIIPNPKTELKKIRETLDELVIVDTSVESAYFVDTPFEDTETSIVDLSTLAFDKTNLDLESNLEIGGPIGDTLSGFVHKYLPGSKYPSQGELDADQVDGIIVDSDVIHRLQ